MATKHDKAIPKRTTGKDKTYNPTEKGAGMTAKGRAQYNAKNNSNLKPPAPHPKTEKDAARRKSFCARMEGMKRVNTSAKTANDPDSRINKSLRAWNCKEGGAIKGDGCVVRGKTKGRTV